MEHFYDIDNFTPYLSLNSPVAYHFNLKGHKKWAFGILYFNINFNESYNHLKWEDEHFEYKN